MAAFLGIRYRKDDGMDFTKLSLKELREMAKEKGLSKVSGLRKAELIEELKKAEILSQSVVRPVKLVETPETKKAEPKVERKPIQEKKNEPEKEKKVYTYVPSQNNTRNNRGRGGATSHSTYQGNNYSNSGAQSNVQNQSQNYSHTGPQEMAHQEPATEIRRLLINAMMLGGGKPSLTEQMALIRRD